MSGRNTARETGFAAICCGLAAIVTWRVVSLSMVFGHLAVPPRPDDVGYMLEGLRRLKLLEQEGFGSWAWSWLADAPHAPWQSALAMVSFAVFGAEQWAPYVATGCVLAGVLVALDRWAFRGLAVWGRVPLVALAASMPLAASAVYTFRPDALMSVLLVGGVGVLVSGRLAEMKLRRVVLAGACFGAALWVKPSTFAQTGLILGWALAVSVVLDLLSARAAFWSRRERRAWFCGTALRAVLVLVMTVGVFAPHFVPNAGRLWGYFWQNTLGTNASVWLSDLAWWEHALYHVALPEGGGLHLGMHAVVLLAAAAVLSRGVRFEGMGKLLLVAAAFYGLSAMNGVKQQFFGMPFQMAAVLWLLLWLAAAVRLRPDKARVVVPMAGVLGLAVWSAPFETGEPARARAEARSAAFEAVSQHVFGGAESVHIGAPLPILTADMLRFEALRRGVELTAFDSIYGADYAALSPAIEASDTVIGVEASRGWQFLHRFPSIDAQRDLVAMYDARPDLERVGVVPLPGLGEEDDGELRVYRRGVSFAGFEVVRGLGRANPRGMRHAYTNFESTVLRPVEAGPGTLWAVVRPAPGSTEAVVTFAGSEPERVALEAWPRWTVIRLAYEGAGEAELRFEPLRASDGTPQPRAQFRSIVFQPRSGENR